jgi:hypothetical protein
MVCLSCKQDKDSLLHHNTGEIDTSTVLWLRCFACALQRALLAAAVQLVKPGGVLVYSTCTISPGTRRETVHHSCCRVLYANFFMLQHLLVGCSPAAQW